MRNIFLIDWMNMAQIRFGHFIRLNAFDMQISG